MHCIYLHKENCLNKSKEKNIKRKSFFKAQRNSPGSFLVRNDAFVIIDFDTVTTFVEGVKATEMPIGPSLGCPVWINEKNCKFVYRSRHEHSNLMDLLEANS